MHVIQTDPEQIGQIYIPVANWLLMMATVPLVSSFQASNNLASAYGLAVSSEMLITTTLAFFVALRWGWPRVAATALCAIFLIVDVAFLAANLSNLWMADGVHWSLRLSCLPSSKFGVAGCRG